MSTSCPTCDFDQVNRYPSDNDFMMISRTSHFVFDMVAFSCLRCGALWFVIDRCVDRLDSGEGVILYDGKENKQ